MRNGDTAQRAGISPARRRLLLALPASPFLMPAAIAQPDRRLEAGLQDAEGLRPLETVLVSKHGTVLAERGYRGHSTTRPTNIKSASKLVVAALVGMAIGRGVLEGTDQRIAPLLAADLPRDPDPRLEQITIGQLLSIQAGLQSTSGPGYGAWVGSRNWVRAALAQPFVEEPGGRMVYSTGSMHLLSAILTRQARSPTLELARRWLGPLPGFAIAAWMRDPQGIHFGGNEMAVTPRALLAFGELYRNGGVTPSGERLLPAAWIAQSWAVRTRSRFTGDGYGYAWFHRREAGQDVHYGWGYGGQMLYVVPGLGLTVAMTSDDTMPGTQGGAATRCTICWAGSWSRWLERPRAPRVAAAARSARPPGISTARTSSTRTAARCAASWTSRAGSWRARRGTGRTATRAPSPRTGRLGPLIRCGLASWAMPAS
jgi:CubicO group peptidase (beta-lactamase class C family)